MTTQQPPRSWRRRILFALALFLTLLVALVAGVRLYLSPARSTELLRSELQRALNVRTALVMAHIGLYGFSTAEGLTLFDEAESPPLLDVEKARADLSVLSALLGQTFPGHADLEGVELTLRFDRDGNLVSKLPAPNGGSGELPLLNVRAATIRLLQEGREPFVLQGATLKTARGQGADQITGTIDDPTWGRFNVTGELKPNPLQLTLRLQQDSARVTPALLRSIPFIPPTVWDHVQPDGTAPLTVALTFQANAPYVRYEVEFADLPMALAQSDRPPFRVDKTSGRLVGDTDKGFLLDGKIHSTEWGHADAHVHLNNATNEVRVHLTVPPTNVTPEKLRALPYVPPTVWEQVSLTGQSPADVVVRISTTDGAIRYRVAASPTAATVGVPIIGLTVNNVSGDFVIEDNLVTIKKANGQSAEGGLTLVSSQLDFREEATKMAFDLAVNGLTLSKLPTRWGIQGRLDGKLVGKANLRLTVRDGRLHTEGSGEGQIQKAKFFGVETTQPIPLKLEAHKNGFRFSSPKLLPGRSAAPVTPLLLALTLVAAPPPPPPPPSPPLAPATLAGRTANAVSGVARVVTDSALLGLDGLSWLERLTRPGQPDTFINTQFTLREVELREFVARTGMTLPPGFSGRISLHVEGGIPINNAQDVRAYRLRGTVTSPRLELAGLILKDVEAEYSLNRGIATIESLRARLGTGRAVAEARALLSPPGDATLALTLQGVPVSALGSFLPEAIRREATGHLSGTLNVTAPWQEAASAQAWRGSGQLTARNLGAFQVIAPTARAEFTLLRGTLLLRDLKADVLGTTLTGEAGLNLSEPFRYTAKLNAPTIDLSKLPPPANIAGLTGKASLSGQFEGRFGTLSNASGEATLATVELAGFKAGPLQANWAFKDDRFLLTDLSGKAEGGTLTGKAELGLGGDGKATVRLAGLDAATLAKRIEGLAIPFTGNFDADIQATFHPPNKIQATADLNGNRLRAGGFPVQGFKGRVEYRDDKAHYNAEGSVFGGKIRFNGQYPPAPKPPAKDDDDMTNGDARLEVQRIRIDQLLKALNYTGPPLSGYLSVDFPFEFDGPRGDGKIELLQLRQGGSELASALRGAVRLRPGLVTLRELNGTFAGGLLRFRAGYRYLGRTSGWFDLSLTRAEASQVMQVVGAPDGSLSGDLEVRLRGNLGPEVRGTGNVLLARGKAAGIEISDWNVPVTFSHVLASGRGEARIRESSAQVGTGRVRASGEALWGERTRLEARISLAAASTRCLAGLLGDVSTFARGTVTGRVDLVGTEVRSVNDLTANVTASLNDTQALRLPVLQVLTPFLGPGQSATVFNKGQLRGRLANGVFRIRELSMESALAQLFISGAVSTAGRLDLDVVARTNAFGEVDPLVARGVLRQIPAIGPVPVGLIVRAADVLSNRVIHLGIQGTARNPIVRIRPLRTLTDESVRFFLLRLAGP